MPACSRRSANDTTGTSASGRSTGTPGSKILKGSTTTRRRCRFPWPMPRKGRNRGSRLCPRRTIYLADLHPLRAVPYWIAARVLQSVDNFRSLRGRVSSHSYHMPTREIGDVSDLSHLDDDRAVRMANEGDSCLDQDIRTRLMLDDNWQRTVSQPFHEFYSFVRREKHKDSACVRKGDIEYIADIRKRLAADTAGVLKVDG